jgi:hypothetical protein
MRIANRLLLLAIFLVPMASSAVADEGMWPLYSIRQLPFENLRARGLKLPPERIFGTDGKSLADAVVQVGGATGSFVSPDGLILTNHHVAFGAVQEQSTVDQNYLRNGFYAPTRDRELQAIGYRVYVTLDIKDVTERILAGVTEDLAPLARYSAIDQNIKAVVRDTEQGKRIKARVSAMFEGKQYMLYTTLELRDIRMVYVPPEAIGNYGGDIDNWMWPRHVGDFAFLRAYVAPNGEPADYSPKNVPYQPSVYLPVSAAGVRERDFCMTIGFPGRTARYISSFDLAGRIDFGYPNSIRTSEDQIALLEAAGRNDTAVALRLASDLAGINNSLKKSYGVMEGFRRGNTLEQKRGVEKQLSAFLASKPELQSRYGHVLGQLDSLYAAKKRTQPHDFLLGRMDWGCDYLRLANTIYRWACEREKPDLERDRGYQDRDTATARQRLRDAQINLVPQADQEVCRYYMARSIALPDEQKVAAIEELFAGSQEGLVAQWYQTTRVGDADARMAMFAMSRQELDALNDPFLNLARKLKPELDAMRDREETRSGAESRLTPLLVQALMEWKQTQMYPDANGSMRLSYGEVKGYVPRDATAYSYLTSLKGIIEKETGKDPFIVPDSLETAYADKDYGPWIDTSIDGIPVNFLTTNDITGGNSGSPVINGEGKLIGVAFDGNWEGVASDFVFDPEVTRTIVCDARFILFVVDRVYHLDELVTELHLKPTGRAFHTQPASGSVGKVGPASGVVPQGGADQ